MTLRVWFSFLTLQSVQLCGGQCRVVEEDAQSEETQGGVERLRKVDALLARLGVRDEDVIGGRVECSGSDGGCGDGCSSGSGSLCWCG